MKQQGIEAVIFDMDGVLVNTEPTSKQAFKQAFETVSLSLDEATYQQMLGRSLNDIRLFLSDKLASPDLGDRIVNQRNQFFLSHYQKHTVEVLPGVRSFLAYLKQCQYKLAVATSSNQETAEMLLKQAAIYHYFDAFSFGSEVQQAKPNPEIFLTAAQRLNVQPNHAYVVEDAVAGILGAVSGGFLPVYIPEGVKDIEAIRQFSYLTFRDLASFHNYMENDKGCQSTS